MTNFTTTEDDKGQRLDKYLTSKLSDTTRSQIKKFIKNGFVTVNDKKTSVHQFLNPGDLINIKPPSTKTIERAVTAIEILEETADCLVINKPAGVLSHANQNDSKSPTVTDWLLKKYPNIKDKDKDKNVGDAERPGIVHRLDKDVSGVMIIAKTQEMYEHLKQQFHDRLIKKTYTALVHGHLPELEGQINKPIGRSTSEARMAARVQSLDSKDKDAITDYLVIKKYKKYDLVQAQPLTGRTHQIRVHFMSMGTPIVGDQIYTIHKQKKIIDLGRIFLHATKISFSDLNNHEQTVDSKIPKDLRDFTNSLA